MSLVVDHRRKLHTIRDLPTLPAIAQKVLALADDDENGPEKLSSIICSDQALAVKVLAVANSAYYGHRAQIGTIRRAVALIGINMLKQISLSVLVGGAVRSRDKNPAGFWKHSMATAIAASTIAGHAGLAAAEVCFMGGLLHDVGKLIIGSYLPDETGLDHTEVGAWMCERWQLPPQLVNAVAYHHSSDLRHLADPMVACVQLADVCAKIAIDGEDKMINPNVSAVLRLTEAKILQTISELRDRSADLDDFLR